MGSGPGTVCTGSASRARARIGCAVSGFWPSAMVYGVLVYEEADVPGAEGIVCVLRGLVPSGRAAGVGDPRLTAADATEFDRDLLMVWWRGAAESDPGVIRMPARWCGCPAGCRPGCGR